MSRAQFIYQDNPITLEFFDENDYIKSRILQHNNFYEFKILQELIRSKSIIENKNIIDVGSYIGNHTVFFSKFLNPSQVYSFEPQTIAYEYLIKNIKGNGLENVHPYNVGLWNHNTKGVINNLYDKNNPGSSHITECIDGDINLHTLDKYQIEDVGLIKIDVEGNEPRVLKGALNTIRKNLPIIMIEATSPNDPRRVRYESILGFLNLFGYKQVCWKGYNMIFMIK